VPLFPTFGSSVLRNEFAIQLDNPAARTDARQHFSGSIGFVK